LLRSLLDGHPSLAVLPSEAHFFQYGGYWVEYSLRHSQPRTWTLQQRADALCRFLEEENYCDDRYGASVMAGRYDERIFRATLSRFSGESVAALAGLYLEAIYRACTNNTDPAGRRIVEKSVENAEYAPALRALFPDSQFVHIVRNPYAVMTALRKARGAAGFPYLGRMLAALQNAYSNLYRNRLALDGYLVVRYEDLVSAPEATMREVAGFLEIEFEGQLLRPTLLGQSWGGNSTSGQTLTGISAGAADRWTAEITDLEIALVNRKLGAAFKDLGYESRAPQHHPLRQWWQPARAEKPLTYLRNRLLRWCV